MADGEYICKKDAIDAYEWYPLGARTKVYRVNGVSEFTSTSTSPIDLTGMTITFTPQSATNPIMIEFASSAGNDTADKKVTLQVVIDGSAQDMSIRAITSPVASSPNTGTIDARTSMATTLSVASHTIKVQAWVDAGTARFVLGRRTLIITEYLNGTLA